MLKTKFKYTVPATEDQGPCFVIGLASPMETAYENALRAYNSMRAHDGQKPLKKFPVGTTVEQINN